MTANIKLINHGLSKLKGCDLALFIVALAEAWYLDL